MLASAVCQRNVVDQCFLFLWLLLDVIKIKRFFLKIPVKAWALHKSSCKDWGGRRLIFFSFIDLTKSLHCKTNKETYIQWKHTFNTACEFTYHLFIKTTLFPMIKGWFYRIRINNQSWQLGIRWVFTTRNHL